MPNVALIPRAATRIAPLVGLVHGFPTGTHRLETTVGGEALEDGREVTDHVVARQARLTLQFVVSDFDGDSKPRDAWAEIRRLQKESEVLEVVTELGTYREMVIHRAEAPQRTRGIAGTIELREIERIGIVDNDLPPENVEAGPAEGRSGEVQRGRVALEPQGDDF